MKLELLTNATVVDDAIRFVSHRSKDKENMKSFSKNINSDGEKNTEPTEPYYDEDDQDQLEEEKQEEEAGEINQTTNQVF